MLWCGFPLPRDRRPSTIDSNEQGTLDGAKGLISPWSVVRIYPSAHAGPCIARAFCYASSARRGAFDGISELRIDLRRKNHDAPPLTRHLRVKCETIVPDETHVLDEGPFYHGTKADMQIGGLLTAGFRSNYNPDVVMNHIYFTALANGAGLAAALAKGDGRERVYIVEPTGSFENDPNVTDKKFPGNPTRSYRTKAPLKIVGEVTDWVRQTPEELSRWREKLAKVNGDSRGEIIN